MDLQLRGVENLKLQVLWKMESDYTDLIPK